MRTVAFGEAIKDRSAGSPKIPQSEYQPVGRIPIVDQGRHPVAGYTNRDDAMAAIAEPCIIFGDHTRILKFVDFPFAVGAEGVKILSVEKGFCPKYVYHYLKSIEIPNAGYSRHFKFLKQVEVPQPHIEEQRRIAAMLDHADALRIGRRRVLAHLDALTQSIFRNMFGDPVSNDRGLPRESIGSVAVVKTGNSPSRADARNFGEEIEWLKSDNLGDHVATRADEGLSISGMERARVAPAGSILVTCIAGSASSIGKASIADRDVAFNQQINAILPSDRIDATFLLGQLKTSPQLVRAMSTGGMKGLVNKSAFISIEVLAPSMDAQREYAQRIQSVMNLRSASQLDLAAQDELLASLQYRAFRGEL